MTVPSIGLLISKSCCCARSDLLLCPQVRQLTFQLAFFDRHAA